MSLLPLGSSTLERNIEKATERMTNVPIPLRQLWNPDTCPESLLPWLAWSLGIDAWKAYWPLSIKRALIKDAINVKRRKGTTKSVRDIVTTFGASIALKENWQTNPPGAPHKFSVFINVSSMGGEPVTADFQQDIIDEITRTKPVRSSFTVTAGFSASSTLALAGAARAAIYTRLELNDI